MKNSTTNGAASAYKTENTTSSSSFYKRTAASPSAGSRERSAESSSSLLRRGQEEDSAHPPLDITTACRITRQEEKEEVEISEMELLRRKSSEKEYQKNISNVRPAATAITARNEIRAACGGIGMAGHSIVSFIWAFFCGYYLSDFLGGIKGPALQALSEGVLSFRTLLLEAALFLIRNSRSVLKEC